MPRKLLLIALLATAAFSSDDNIPVIRVTGDAGLDVEVRKFEDGPNTCYVAMKRSGGYNSSPSISCVKR